MRKSSIAVLICVVASVLAVSVLEAVAQHPSWAYGFVEAPPPGSVPAPFVPPPTPAVPAAGAAPAAPTDTAQLSLPGATRTFTRTQANDPYGPADWFPGDHPLPVPEIVAHGRRDAASTRAACATTSAGTAGRRTQGSPVCRTTISCRR
jgi:hypothetical protein